MTGKEQTLSKSTSSSIAAEQSTVIPKKTRVQGYSYYNNFALPQGSVIESKSVHTSNKKACFFDSKLNNIRKCII